MTAVLTPEICPIHGTNSAHMFSDAVTMLSTFQNMAVWHCTPTRHSSTGASNAD